MGRLSVLAVVMAGALAAACASVTTAPTDAPSTTVATPTAPSPTPMPSPSPSPSPAPTPAPTPTARPSPTPSEEPARTLAPGETPGPSPLDISNFLTATLNVVNLTDFDTRINVDIYSDGENQGSVAALDLEPYGSMFQSVLPGDYGVTFGPDGDALTCLLTIKEGQEIDFTLVGEDILISDAAVPPTDPEDLFVETSSLCER